MQGISRSSRIATTSVPSSTASPLVVFSDRERTIQVLLNLLTNALRHTPENGTITIEAHPAENGRIAMESLRGVGPSPSLILLDLVLWALDSVWPQIKTALAKATGGDPKASTFSGRHSLGAAVGLVSEVRCRRAPRRPQLDGRAQWQLDLEEESVTIRARLSR